MKKKLILQPGKMGDIVITTPIAQYYADQGYEVVWPVFDNYIDYFKQFPDIKTFSLGVSMNPYVYYTNTRIDANNPDVFIMAGVEFFRKLAAWLTKQPDQEEYEVLDFCFTFPGHRNDINNQMTQIFSKRNRNWIDLKYFLANVPLQERWNYSWTRDLEKEQKLYNFITSYAKEKYGSEKYSIVHQYKNGKKLPDVEVSNPINFSYIKGYEIYDWTMVLENAQAIMCVDSCLANYVEVIPSLKKVTKHYLGSEEPHFHPYMRNILINNWINHSESDVAYNEFSLD